MKGPLFKWFGSKWNASKHYPAPKCDSIIEPFAGSACYSLRHASKQVVIYDSDPNLQVLWRWLIDEATEEAIRVIPLNLPVGTDIRTLQLPVGQASLLKHWQRTNNVGDCWTISPWGDKPGQWTANTRARVACEVGEIKHWKFEAPKLDDIATWFIDPPYEFNYKYRMGGIDYSAWGAGIQQLSGQVIACEAVCPKTGAIPTWLDFKPFRDTVTSRRKAHQSHHSKELMYYVENQ